MKSSIESDGFSFSRDYFSLFGMTANLQLDKNQLKERFMQLQRQYHPDRFASAAAGERRLAVQISSFVNEAHQTLSDSLSRAEYCLKLEGIDVGAETDSAMPVDFLMEQLELREELEALEEGDGIQAQVDVFRQEMNQRRNALFAETDRYLQAGEFSAARGVVRKWQFIDKLDREAAVIEARLDDF